MSGTLDSVTIEDESAGKEQRFQLYIGGSPQALVTRGPDGIVKFHWQVHGPQYWPEALYLIQGLVQLSVHADRLSLGMKPKEDDHGDE